MQFINDAKPIELDEYNAGRPGRYRYDRPSAHLMLWSRFFQTLISQAGTWLLTGKFHNQECGIYKSEGGCNIIGVGELVLGDRSCYFDMGQIPAEKKDQWINDLANLVTEVVLRWDPMDPIQSMLYIASAIALCNVDELGTAISNGHISGPFGGDSLGIFFDRVRQRPPTTDHRPYQRYVMTTHGGKTDAEVDQLWADQDLGKELKARLVAKVEAIFTCTPHRNGDELLFWVNAGGNRKFDGWKTQAEIEAFLASDELPQRRDR